MMCFASRGDALGVPRVCSLGRLGLLCCLGLAFCVGPLFAQQAPATGEQTPIGQSAAPAAAENAVRVPGVSTWDFVRMVLVLAAVIAAIYLVFWFLRRTTRRASSENDLITVLGSKSLAGNRSLHLVRVGKSVYLVGSAESGVGLVSEISDKESVDELVLRAAQQPGSGKKSFSEILGTIVPQSGGGRLALADGLGFLKRQKDRVRKLGGV